MDINKKKIPFKNISTNFSIKITTMVMDVVQCRAKWKIGLRHRTVHFNFLFRSLYSDFYFSFFIAEITCLRNVELRAVEAIRAGETLHLECNYDLENALLYTIKWYFEDNEFYRYVPKESPPTRVFPLPGINVDVSLPFYPLLIYYSPFLHSG